MSAIADEAKLAALYVGEALWSGTKWVGGTLGGEFTLKRTTGQIVVDAVISMFPIAGEITAARDSIAIVLRMCDDPKACEDKWEWISLVLCLLAIIPVFGGILKGVGKLLMRGAQKSENLIKLGREIIAFVRKMGYGDAYKWLKELDFAKYQAPVLNAFNELIKRIGGALEFITNKMGAALPEPVLFYLTVLRPKLLRVQELGARMIPQGLKDLNELLERVRQKLVEGTWADVTVGTSGSKVMTEEARLAEAARDMGVSLGHKAAEPAHFKPKEGWVDLSTPKFVEYISTFSVKAPIEAITYKPGTTMVRVVDAAKLGSPWTIPGRFWATHLPPNGTKWRTECAVKHGWNMNGSYAEVKVPSAEELREAGISVPEDWNGMRLWSGRIAEQIDDAVVDGAKATMRLLVGGDIQLFVDFEHAHNAPIREWIKLKAQAMPTRWTDVQLLSQKEAQAVLLAERERSEKVRQEGYVLRGSATAGKQTTEKAQ